LTVYWGRSPSLGVVGLFDDIRDIAAPSAMRIDGAQFETVLYKQVSEQAITWTRPPLRFFGRSTAFWINHPFNLSQAWVLSYEPYAARRISQRARQPRVCVTVIAQRGICSEHAVNLRL
jgi:hypothetical protein